MMRTLLALFRALSAAVFLCICSALPIFAQSASAGLVPAGEQRTADEGFASQEFRRGVQAYYRGSFNDAVLQFEKALSYLPENNLIMDWLGKAYYHSGMEGTAVQSWIRAGDTGYGGLLLQNKIEIVQERRIAGELMQGEQRFTEAGSFPGVYNDNLIFSGPVSVLPNSNGTAWVLAYGTNELVELNVNGSVITRVTGPLNGFDRPVDIIRLADSNLLISESAGDRLALFSKKGRFIKHFGKKGLGLGELLGPQYMAQDSRNNIYVSDYGNSRIDVFDSEGTPLFFFGKADGEFEGLRGPTGIAVIGDSIFVADDFRGAIYEFDQAGNFRRMLSEPKTFVHPESMKSWGDYLVVCDSNKVISVDSRTGARFENVRTGNAPSRLTSAVPDANGNLLVTDIKTNEVYVMTKLQELVGGLFVQIERVNASRFPEVLVDISVENRHRKPVVGLKNNNFFITEQKRPVSKLKFVGAASENSYADVTLLIDRSMAAKPYEEQITAVVRELSEAMNGKGTLRILSAGRVPAVEYVGRPSGALKFSASALKTPYSDSVPLDLALRLCVNDLVNAEKKRAIIMISPGKVSIDAFEKYSLSETAAYLNNNRVPVLSVLVNQAAGDEEYEFIVSHTPGGEYYMFRPEGLSSVISDIVDIPNGVYTFSFTSALTTNFGEKYLPIEVETYLLNRSGRDESGYFAPLQ